MRFPKYRFQNADVGADGAGSTTLMTDGALSTPAATSTASAEATPVVKADATQLSATEAAQAATDAAAAAALTPEAIAKAEADKATADAKAGEKVAPEKYEIKAPEGVILDAEVLGQFEGLAKELKLSQEEAQKLADVGTQMSQKWASQQAEAIQTAAAEWATASSSDKEFGGDKLTESLAVSKKALDAFGTPELSKLLNESRLGNHPEVIRFMYRAGKAISEDRMVTGGAGPASGSDVSVAKSLYPNQS